MKLGILIYVNFLLVTSSSFVAAICDIGWQEHSGYCYYVSSTSSTWYQADQECKDLGAQLTSIQNYDEISFISNITDFESAYWIGLTAVCTKDYVGWSWYRKCNWQWTDKSSTAYIAKYLYDNFDNCWLISNFYTLKATSCINKIELWETYFIPIYYVCKKETRDSSLPEVPQVTPTKASTPRETSATTTTISLITTIDVFISADAMIDTNKVIPVVVAISVVVLIIVIVVVVVCMKRRKQASQSQQQQQQQQQQQPQQQQQAERNIYSVPPVIPSAPPLESLYDSRTESVIVQGSVLNPNINTNDEHVYTTLTNRSRSTEPDGTDNPSYETQEGAVSMSPSGSDTAQYTVVKKVKRDPSELELYENTNYETHSNGWSQ